MRFLNRYACRGVEHIFFTCSGSRSQRASAPPAPHRSARAVRDADTTHHAALSTHGPCAHEPRAAPHTVHPLCGVWSEVLRNSAAAGRDTRAGIACGDGSNNQALAGAVGAVEALVTAADTQADKNELVHKLRLALQAMGLNHPDNMRRLDEADPALFDELLPQLAPPGAP